MKKAPLWSIGLAVAGFSAGCGSGMDPMLALNQGGALPALVLPLVDSQVNTVSPFSESGAATANDGFDVTSLTLSQSVISPGPGVVSFVDLTTGAGIVYIVHSQHLVSRLSRLQSVSVQPGAVVQAGSGVGLSSAVGAPVHFTVFYDNALVCPQSFLSYAEQRVAVTHSGGVSPCL